MDREKVLRLLCRGASNEEIAHELNYSHGYVKNTLSRLMHEQGARSRAQLAAIHTRKEVRAVA